MSKPFFFLTFKRVQHSTNKHKLKMPIIFHCLQALKIKDTVQSPEHVIFFTKSGKIIPEPISEVLTIVSCECFYGPKYRVGSRALFSKSISVTMKNSSHCTTYIQQCKISATKRYPNASRAIAMKNRDLDKQPKTYWLFDFVMIVTMKKQQHSFVRKIKK